MKPANKPSNPCFSSGPCAKHPGYTIDELKDAPLGRSHRSSLGKEKLALSIAKTKEILNIPEDYKVGIVPASDTGAFEMLMWNVLGPRPVDVLVFESFGKGWANDIKNELKLENVNILSADYGELPDLSQVNFDHDVVFTWNGTTSGVKIPNGDWIPSDRKGLTLCDATSAVFAMDIPWDKIDALTFSWQKVLGGEAAHGMLVISPRVVERLESYNPPWPLPKIFRIKKKGKLDESIFEGSTINTPSMLCNEDYLQALKWAESIGGLKAMIARSEENLSVLEDFVAKHNWIHFLAKEKQYRSNTSVCFTVDLPEDKLKNMIKLLAEEKVAYDIGSYKEAPTGLRIWCGATVEKSDLELLCQWLEWAYESVSK
ncbi:phosphoserine transaminase [Acetivibrio clariflavus]|uniref:phosphoserine transaminase n=1 Tax=Acetivibrio clariflavus (strain DSM 19732 / NBRC 101661 / EBR45) TaxID=720554 RepID=G8LW93_ACECE|nr:phosphoserine transaminase [Acetivibrio clariflavus]AEV69740.1 phosphoserine aminotransferase [Acetivibrio clariflavus DSM 19732]